MFSDRLKELMNQDRVTNYRLHKELGVSNTTIANWLDGKSAPDVPALAALSQFFRVSSDYLLGLTDDASPKIKEAPPQDAMERALRSVGAILPDGSVDQVKIDHIKDFLRLTGAIKEHENKGG